MKHLSTHLVVIANVANDRFRRNGFLWLIRGFVKRTLLVASWLVMVPISLPLHLIGFRRILIRTEHIGHLSAEFDTFIKEKDLGLIPSRRWFVTAPLTRVSNSHLLDYWRPFVPIISHKAFCAFLDTLSQYFFMREDVSRYISTFFGPQDIYRINKLWDKRSPILSLTERDELWASNALNQLGITSGKWFVCVHVREGGFLPNNELIQSHRNANVACTIPAMQEIVRRGGICVRMGDQNMTPLPPLEGVIDYAHHPLKSDKMDVVLCAKARFFLGCTSGLAFLSAIFGVPIAQANMIPVEALAIRHCDISIPKLLRSNSLGRHLRFDEILKSDIGGYYFSHQYKQAGIYVDENKPEDILELVTEMLDRLDGTFTEHEDDQALHARYMSLFKPGHYSYEACSRVCIGFLRRHRHLLNPEDECLAVHTIGSSAK